MSAPEETTVETVEEEEHEWQVSLTVACYATITVWAETEEDAKQMARDDLMKSDLEIDYAEVDEVKQVSS